MFELEGLDALERRIGGIVNSLEQASQEGVPFAELFTETFLWQHARFRSFTEFLEAGGFKVACQADFEAIPDDEFDRHVAKVTDFHDWDAMMSAAASDWFKERMGL